MDRERLVMAIVRWGAILIPRLIIGATALSMMMTVYQFTGSKEMAWAMFGSFLLIIAGLELLLDSLLRSQKPPGGPPAAGV